MPFVPLPRQPACHEGFVAHSAPPDMEAIHGLIGACPQHDRLWPELTGREHLAFYGRLKGLAGARAMRVRAAEVLHVQSLVPQILHLCAAGPELAAAVDEGLRSVSLTHVADQRSGRYSGGMRRRLSVAISFVGDPVAVYLDEPSTVSAATAPHGDVPARLHCFTIQPRWRHATVGNTWSGGGLRALRPCCIRAPPPECPVWSQTRNLARLRTSGPRPCIATCAVGRC